MNTVTSSTEHSAGDGEGGEITGMLTIPLPPLNIAVKKLILNSEV